MKLETSWRCRSVIFNIWLFWHVFSIIFWFIKNENGSEHLHYLLSNLIWSGCNHRGSELEKISGNHYSRHLFLVSCKLMKHPRRFSFVSNFIKLTFARLSFLNFSSKSPWWSPVPLKFESYNLQHCKKNLFKLVFWVFSEQLLYHIIFGQVHWKEV